MLPNFIYKSLPYIYIAIGFLCWMIIDSDIVYIPFVILVSLGVIVLWMRREAKNEREYGLPVKASEEEEYMLRERIRRLPDDGREFPITDDNGNMVAFDRRQGERRKKEE